MFPPVVTKQANVFLIIVRAVVGGGGGIMLILNNAPFFAAAIVVALLMVLHQSLATIDNVAAAADVGQQLGRRGICPGTKVFVVPGKIMENNRQ